MTRRVLVLDLGDDIEVSSFITKDSSDKKEVKVTTNSWRMEAIKRMLEEAYLEAGYEITK